MLSLQLQRWELEVKVDAGSWMVLAEPAWLSESFPEAQNRKETESGLDRVAPILISAMRMLKTIMIIGMILMGCTLVRWRDIGDE